MLINKNHKVSVRTKPSAVLDLVDPINAHDESLTKVANNLRKVVDNILVDAVMEGK